MNGRNPESSEVNSDLREESGQYLSQEENVTLIFWIIIVGDIRRSGSRMRITECGILILSLANVWIVDAAYDRRGGTKRKEKRRIIESKDRAYGSALRAECIG